MILSIRNVFERRVQKKDRGKYGRILKKCKRM